MDIHYRIHKKVKMKPSPLDPVKQRGQIMDEDVHEITNKCIIDEDLIIHPFAFYEQNTKNQILLMMKQQDVYVLPTEELFDFLDGVIDDQFAIEIGAGKGYLGRELDIPITDSYAKRDPFPMRMDKRMGVPTITYPSDVEKLDAISSVRKYNPHTVIASFLVHEKTYTDGSKKFGVDGVKLLKACKRYIHIGNLDLHCDNPILNIPHIEIEFPYLITTRMSPLTDRIFIWGEDGMDAFAKKYDLKQYMVRYEVENRGFFDLDFVSSKNNISERAKYWMRIDQYLRFKNEKGAVRLVDIE